MTKCCTLDERTRARHARPAPRAPQYPARPLQLRFYPIGWLVYPAGASVPGVVLGRSGMSLYKIQIAGSTEIYPVDHLRSATRVEASRHGKLIEENR